MPCIPVVIPTHPRTPAPLRTLHSLAPGVLPRGHPPRGCLLEPWPRGRSRDPPPGHPRQGQPPGTPRGEMLFPSPAFASPESRHLPRLGRTPLPPPSRCPTTRGGEILIPRVTSGGDLGAPGVSISRGPPGGPLFCSHQYSRTIRGPKKGPQGGPPFLRGIHHPEPAPTLPQSEAPKPGPAPPRRKPHGSGLPTLTTVRVNMDARACS